MIALLLAFLPYGHAPSPLFITTELLQESLLLARPRVTTLHYRDRHNTVLIEPILKTSTDNRSQLGAKVTLWNRGFCSSHCQKLFSIHYNFNIEGHGPSFFETLPGFARIKNRRYQLSFGGRILPNYKKHPSWGLGGQAAFSWTSQMLLIRRGQDEVTTSIELRTPWGLGTWNWSIGFDGTTHYECKDIQGTEFNWVFQKANVEILAAFYRRQTKHFDEPITGVACALGYNQGNMRYAFKFTFDNFNKSQWSFCWNYLPTPSNNYYITRFLRKDFEMDSAPVRFNSKAIARGQQETYTLEALEQKTNIACSRGDKVRYRYYDLLDIQEKLVADERQAMSHFINRFVVTHKPQFSLESEEITQLKEYAKLVPSMAMLDSRESYESKPMITLDGINRNYYTSEILREMQTIIQFMRWLHFFQEESSRSENQLIKKSDLSIKWRVWNTQELWDFSELNLKHLYFNLPERDGKLILSVNSEQARRLYDFCHGVPRSGFDGGDTTADLMLPANTLSTKRETFYKLLCLKASLRCLGSVSQTPQLKSLPIESLYMRCLRALDIPLHLKNIASALTSCSDHTRMALLSFSRLESNEWEYQTFLEKLRRLPSNVRENIISVLLYEVSTAVKLKDDPQECGTPHKEHQQLYKLNHYLLNIQNQESYKQHMGIFYVFFGVNEQLTYLFS